MTAFFSVKNFEKFQHYKDRSPPWIKLYNELLDDYDFGLLPDASKWHLVAIWLLASRSNNKIPLDPAWVAKRINASAPVDLSILRNAGFIEFDQPCSETLAPRKQVAEPEGEGEDKLAEEEGEILPDKSGASKPNSYSEDFEKFWQAYPTDVNMPKKRAFVVWRKLSPQDRVSALSAVPGFRRYCETNKSWYRPIYADRFLSQGKFEGYAAEPTPDPAAIEAAKDRADKLLKRGKYAVAYQ